MSASFGTGSTGATEGTVSTSTSQTTTTGSGTADTGPKFDLPSDADIGGPGGTCNVVDMDAVPPCTNTAPPDSFTPEVQWSWTEPDGEEASVVTPLVVNLTDDNDDGEIDLCDIPDVVVVAYDAAANWPNGPAQWVAHLWVLDGATGTPHFEIETEVSNITNPAVGDIDGDGLPEILTGTPSQGMSVFEHDGTLKWSAPTSEWISQSAIALADLDGDSEVEILIGLSILDAQGQTEFQASVPIGPAKPAPTAADLDGDGDLEFVIGRSAYHHDGTPHYEHNEFGGTNFEWVEVADVDADGLPEVLVHSSNEFWILEHDGTVKNQLLNNYNKSTPAAIHDIDGDGEPEIALNIEGEYRVYNADFSVLWNANVTDASGYASGTAFDFLGDGTAEGMYADETTLFVFDEGGSPLLTNPRSSWTQFEYPVVADVDNDGSAEIVVVSNDGYMGQSAATVQVIRDMDDRWIQARRIWNQHTYHVTNVREDGTIPEQEPPHWESLNTFRTNSQIENGGVCKPEG